jgi:L-iditol 2-dehydrogenase
MKALVKTQPGPGNLALQDVDAPKPGREDAVIRVRASGVCGTDVHILHGRYRTSTPIIIGHEFSGEIAEVGPDVTGWAVGDRVVVENKAGACGTCRLCRTGNPHICAHKLAYGTDSHGALAEYAAFHQNALHRIPDNISFEDAALTEPLVVVNHGLLERATISPASTVVVLGAGTIGLMSIQVAKAIGVAHVILAGTSKDGVRLALGKELGADTIVNVEEENLREVVSRLTSNDGADVVIEASGSPKASAETIHLAARAGKVIVIGLTGSPVSIDWDLAVFKEIDVHFSKSSTYMSWVRALKMISSGDVKTAPLITHRFGLEDWREALRVTETGEAVKALVIPNGGAK